MTRFTYRGYAVQLRRLEGESTAVWVAEVEDSDMLHVIGGNAGDDEAAIRPLVHAWIDDGMPNGGASA